MFDGSTVPVMNLSDVDYTIKKGDTVTRGVLFTEENTPIINREINIEPIQIHEIVSDLDDDEIVSVEQILNEHRGVVARNLRQIGCTNLAEMKIKLKDDQPVVYRPYRLSYYERERVRDLVEELKEADIIEDSN